MVEAIGNAREAHVLPRHFARLLLLARCDGIVTPEPKW
jgi:hypothetical protein